MATTLDHPLPNDADIIGSRLGRIDPDNFSNQRTDADEDDVVDDTEADTGLFDEPIDEEGDPTGEHDHHQDDNYALGGHVTRSGSV